MKSIICLGFICAVVTWGGNDAFAKSEFAPILNSALGTSSLSCSACHSGSASESNANLPVANTWRIGADLALSDSDGDGFTNKQEVSSGLTNFNDFGISPFTIAKNAEFSPSFQVVVFGTVATEVQITDIYAQAGIAVPAGSEIVSAVSPVVVTFPATITFASPLTSTSKIYVVDLATNTNTLISSGVTFNQNGSVTITGLTGPVNMVAERVIPIAPAAGSGGYTTGEEEEACMTGQLSFPAAMFFLMLVLGFAVRQK